MIGSFLTRGLVMVFGYAYPAYECFKTVERNKPDIEQLRFWCQYWILVAMLTVSERVGDVFISWVPMYSEAKLAFFIYLWCPKTMGTTYVYNSFFKPLVAEHETEIDRSLSELKTQGSDLLVRYCQKAINYGQTRVFDVLQYIAAQSPQPAKKQEQVVRASQTTAPLNHKGSSTAVTMVEEQVSTSSQKQDEVSEVVVSKIHVTLCSPAALNASKVTPTPYVTESIEASMSSSEAELMEIDSVPSSVTIENAQTSLQETVIEENVRVTRAMAKKTQTTPTK